MISSTFTHISAILWSFGVIFPQIGNDFISSIALTHAELSLHVFFFLPHPHIPSCLFRVQTSQVAYSDPRNNWCQQVQSNVWWSLEIYLLSFHLGKKRNNLEETRLLVSHTRSDSRTSEYFVENTSTWSNSASLQARASAVCKTNRANEIIDLNIEMPTNSKCGIVIPSWSWTQIGSVLGS